MGEKWDKGRRPSKLRELIPLLQKVKVVVEQQAEETAAKAQQLSEQALREAARNG